MTPCLDTSPPRHFPDAERAIDPLLCEEDRNFLFREFCPTRGAWMRGASARMDFLLPFAPMILMIPVGWGAVRIELFVAVSGVAMAIPVLVRFRNARIRRTNAAAGRMEHAQVEDVFSGRELAAAWEAGMPARDVAVAEYLVHRKYAIPGLRVAAIAAGCLLVAIAMSFLQTVPSKVAGMVLGAPVLWNLWRRSRLLMLRIGHPRSWLHANHQRGVRLSAPEIGSAFTRSGFEDGGQFLAGSVLALLAGVTCLVMPFVLAVQGGSGLLGHWYSFAVGLAMTIIGLNNVRAAVGARDNRGRTEECLLAAGRLWRRDRTLLDEDSPDSRRILAWLESPLRSPHAPCPEKDERWMQWCAVSDGQGGAGR